MKRLMRVSPVGAISMELVRFDLQQMENPAHSGVEYQQGRLAGYEVREYRLKLVESDVCLLWEEGHPPTG